MASAESILLRKIGRRKEEIHDHVISDANLITDITYREAEGYETYEEGLKGKFKPIKVGDFWGGNRNGWFKLHFRVPSKWKGRKVFGLFNFGAEACVFIEGKPFHGLGRGHHEVMLLERFRGGEEFELVVDAISGAPWGPEKSDEEYPKVPLQLSKAELAVKNTEVEEYWYNLEVLHLLAEQLPQDSTRRARIIYTLNKSVDAFDYTHTDEASLKGSAVAANKILLPLLECKADNSALTMAVVGHSHIDAAWKWPFRETRRKCSRTFSSQLRLMERYPEYIYTQGQALLYQFVKEDHPGLYEEIRKRAKEGRWDVTGSMWVEADCNLSSGESLVRQILIGKNFYKDEFGVETDVLWLPDVFGYSAALPQILKKSGVDYFFTNKIHWSDTNNPPYGTFYWKGIDGTSILSHFPPSSSYNGFPNPEWLLGRYVKNWQEKDRADQILFTFGWGDGGGGPEDRHLEYLRRERDLEGLPKCEMKRVQDFFHSIDNGTDYHEWQGELYLEYHRGTYTTQARNKKHNRKAEFLFREAEMLSWIAAQTGLPYPYEELNQEWKEILACQFHDVIPGTSIRHVYEQTEETYAKVFQVGERFVGEALSRITGDTGAKNDGRTAAVFNSLPWDRVDIVTLPQPDSGGLVVVDATGTEVPSQCENGRIKFTAKVPSVGYSIYRLVNKAPTKSKPEVKVSKNRLENRFYNIELDNKGLITSIVHKETGREVLMEGQLGNLLRVYEDKPINWPAWDIDFYHADKFEDVTDLQWIKPGAAGPVYGSLKLARKYGQSEIRQRIIIYADNPRIDFETWVDWHEKEKLLKVVFPVDVNSDKARYEIQFGNVERPTHANTSWDFAKFEVCAHKWADLSEGRFGVSLMNDCKYGHSIRKGVMQLSLLRSAKKPDPEADMGEHEFVYSLMPHSGDYVDAEVVRRAYELNVPMRPLPISLPADQSVESKSFLSIDVPNVVLETMKRAEKEGATILRFYECHNSRARATVKLELPLKKVYECDLMERNIREIPTKDGGFSFEMRPFEIKTFKAFLAH